MPTDSRLQRTPAVRSDAQREAARNMARLGTLVRQTRSLKENLLPKLDSVPVEAWTPELIGELARILQKTLPEGTLIRVEQTH